jgi:hypothetical protein
VEHHTVRTVIQGIIDCRCSGTESSGKEELERMERMAMGVDKGV